MVTRLSAESDLEQWQDAMDVEEIYIRIKARHESGLFTRDALMQELLHALRATSCPKDQADQWFDLLWQENAITAGPPGTWKFTDEFDRRMDRVKSRWQVRFALQRLLTVVIDSEAAFGMRFPPSELSWDAGCGAGDLAWPKGSTQVPQLTDAQVVAELDGLAEFLKDRLAGK